ncbi:Cyclophilin-like [Parelusimicrobium proximum]|uniref:cyclophilin-like fold protein n=1 Tax=Parelusimicrobium proximum TaxID=3228953 RepID=UPI003D176ED2
MRKIILISVFICLSVISFKYSGAKDMRTYTKIEITAGGETITADINNTKTAQDFLALLPMEATLEDYVKKEKIIYLNTKLSVEGAPLGADPAAGDIAYYAPWGNVAVFYKDAPYANGLIIIGKIDKGVGTLNTPRDIKVKIEIAGK